MIMIEKVAAGGMIKGIIKAIPKDVKGAARAAYEKTKKDVMGSGYVKRFMREGKRRGKFDAASAGKTMEAGKKVGREAKKRAKGAFAALGGGS